jgi:hypothetical protein
MMAVERTKIVKRHAAIVPRFMRGMVARLERAHKLLGKSSQIA